MTMLRVANLLSSSCTSIDNSPAEVAHRPYSLLAWHRREGHDLHCDLLVVLTEDSVPFLEQSLQYLSD